MKSNTENIFDDLDDLLGEPTLLTSEDTEKYKALQKEIERRLKPKDFFEAMAARDIVNSIWEGKRFQDYATAILDAERRKALKKLSDPKSGYVPDTSKIAKLVAAYHAGSTDVTEVSLLKKLGISSAAVDGHSVLQAADNFLILDRLVANRIATRKAALKDYQRQERLTAKRRSVAMRAKAEQKMKAKAGQEKKTDWADDD